MALAKEVWVDQIKEGFYPDTSFLKRAVDYSELTENNIIHLASAGVDPVVLINNTTYPIKTVKREDKDYTAELDKFETENTVVRRPEVIEYSYDQLESVIRQHRATLRTAVSKKAIHAYAPAGDTTDTPVILTTGETKDGRKRMCYEDFLVLKERFDDAQIPLEDRCIVLHPKHVTDLLLEDIKLFKDLTNLKEGKPFTFAGFDCYQFPYMPTYSTVDSVLTKEEYGKGSSTQFASVAFCGSEVMKADGEIFMYSRENDPEERATIVGFDKRFIALPIRGKGIGAIVSATAA